MNTEFDIKMTTGAMYRFLMYHAYHSFSGIFSILAGAALLVYFFVKLPDGGTNHWIYLLFGVLFLLYQPWTLYTMAVRQAKLNPVFKEPLHYVLSDEGIAATQGENESRIMWDAVKKVRSTRRCIFVYTGDKNACIWIREQMGDKEGEACGALKKYVPEKLVKLR